MSRPSAIWISWEVHRRSRELAAALGAPLFELTSSTRGAARYVTLLVRTTALIVRRRPSLVFVQCPSIVLGWWVTVLKELMRYRVVADLHNEAVVPFAVSSGWSRTLVRRIHRRADLCIVSNPALLAPVKASGGRACALPDRIPTILRRDVPARAGSFPRVVFVCTFAVDEPYLEVIEAARALQQVATVFVTGDPSGHGLPADLPTNVRLTGFLPPEAYNRLLAEADVIVDLTAMENCLVCGAYEAVAVGTPLVTSDTLALRSYFRRGTIFTRHVPGEIAQAIAAAIERRQALASEMALLRRELTEDWEGRFAEMTRLLGTQD